LSIQIGVERLRGLHIGLSF